MTCNNETFNSSPEPLNYFPGLKRFQAQVVLVVVLVLLAGLAAGCWLLAAGCLRLAGCWMLAAGCWLLVAGCWLLASGGWLAAGCWLLAAGRWLLLGGADWQAFKARCQDRRPRAAGPATVHDNMQHDTQHEPATCNMTCNMTCNTHATRHATRALPSLPLYGFQYGKSCAIMLQGAVAILISK